MSNAKAPTPYSSMHSVPIARPDHPTDQVIDESERATLAACTIAGYMPWLPPTDAYYGDDYVRLQELRRPR
jgi:hypothetical protein